LTIVSVAATLEICQKSARSVKSSKEEFEKNICDVLRAMETANRTFMAQADRKAQMLVQVNGGMVSVLLGLTLYVQPAHRWFFLPLGLQMAGSFAVIASCLLVTQPRYFHSYVIDGLMKDRQAIANFYPSDGRFYWDLIRDTHRQAVLLAKKYRQLRLSYQLFAMVLLLTFFSTLGVFLVAG